MVIINPNNPLGSVYSEKNLSEVVKLCAEYDVPIFYDGSYDQLILEGKQVRLQEGSKGQGALHIRKLAFQRLQLSRRKDRMVGFPRR